MEQEMKVIVSCGCYVGLPEWQKGLSDWIYEPRECQYEDIITVSKEEWDEGVVTKKCPSCNSILTQEMDHFLLP